MKAKNNLGFTLIEILLVIALIGVLSSTMVIAINPAHQFAKARDTQRETDLYVIVSAIYQYSSEHSGELPDTDGDPTDSNFPTSATCIGTDVGCFNLANAGEDGEKITPVYMVEMPMDPSGGTPENTLYSIHADENGRLVASASAETKDPIVVHR